MKQLPPLKKGGFLLALLLNTAIASASPFIPDSDDQVLERLPRWDAAVDPPMRELRTQWQATPDNVQVAAQLARRHIERARANADPRHYGYAEAVLATWWSLPQPPVEIWILRATLRQSRHEFDGALADLDSLLAVAPDHAQAWLTRAVILQVRGDYPAAVASCKRLIGQADNLVTATCLSAITGLQGQAPRSYAALQQALTHSPHAGDADKQFALSVLAELAVRVGDHAAAEQHFQQALAIHPDPFVQGSYADFLLDQGNAAKVRDLLRDPDSQRMDGLLLRLALAERQQGASAWQARWATLKDRFAASRRRGDTLHLRDEARALLHLADQPIQALTVALENWQTMREPADARWVLEAALAAHRPQAAQPVIAWLQKNGLQDPLLAQLRQQLESQ